MDVMEKLIKICFREFCDIAGDSPCGCDGCHYGEYDPDNGGCFDEYKKDKIEKLENDMDKYQKEDNGITVQEWISVNDRLPEDDLPKGTKKKMIRCLVYTNKGTIKPCVRQRWEVNGKLVPWQWNKELFAKPTHWMYYPHPPKGE